MQDGWNQNFPLQVCQSIDAPHHCWRVVLHSSSVCVETFLTVFCRALSVTHHCFQTALNEKHAVQQAAL